MNRIVVGIDGSKESRRALEWAIDQAQQQRAHLHVVSSYDVPVVTSAYRFGGVVDPVDLEARAREGAEHRLEEVMGDVAVPEGIEVTQEVVEAVQPARALIDRARDADLLVLGSRGRGGFTGLLLGSVSQQCVHHAPCTVVVVR